MDYAAEIHGGFPRCGFHISTAGLRLYRWYEDQGITDLEDLCWLMWFYTGDANWTPNLVASAISSVRSYYRDNHATAAT